MPEPTVNIEALIAPIPGDNPAGEAVSFAIRNDLEEKRKEIDPDQFDPDDPTRPEEAKVADWSGIIDVASDTLAEKSKDLLVAARLTEALTKVHGFPGLADGLTVMRRIVDEGWDRCWPDISDGDLEVRGGPFNWLAENARGARFPMTVRACALVRGAGFNLGYREYRAIADGKGVSKEDFDRGIVATPREFCQDNVDAIARVQGEIAKILEVLVAKIGNDAPALSDLRAAVSECATLAKQILDRKGGDGSEAEAGSAVAGESSTGGGGSGAGAAGRAIATREDVYRRLEEAADVLQRLEPHSPIPYLLRRAKKLGAMTFPELIRELLSDGGNLDTITKHFGIDPPPSDY